MSNDPNQTNSTGHQDLHDDHGLPSVNRRVGSNKLVTVIGTIFLSLAGIAMIVAVNSDDKGKPVKKNQVADRVESNLPKLVIPATPSPPAPPGPLRLAQKARSRLPVWLRGLPKFLPLCLQMGRGTARVQIGRAHA